MVQHGKDWDNMKVALCLYGLVGSTSGKSSDKKGGTSEVLNLCYDAFKKMIIDKYVCLYLVLFSLLVF